MLKNYLMLEKHKLDHKNFDTNLDVGEFIAILFPSAGEALAKLSRNFPNIEQVKVRKKCLIFT